MGMCIAWAAPAGQVRPLSDSYSISYEFPFPPFHTLSSLLARLHCTIARRPHPISLLRTGQKGTAITLAQRKDSAALDELRALLVAPSAAPDAAGRAPTLLRALPGFTGASAEALRYRAEDVAAGLSKKKIQEARAKEIKAEILNSEKLREHFEENPQDLAILKHDKPLVDLQNAPHLKRIPAYLRETTGRKSFVPRSEGGSVPPPKRRKTAGGKDPLKAPAFLKAPKRGGAVDDELTEMEKRALAKGKRDANRLKKGRQGSGAKKVQ